MSKFELPGDIMFNTEKIADPASFAKTRNAASWLYLNGAEFASMEGGMSYAQVEKAVARAVNVISDPPRVLDLDLARKHVEALDALPRPTLVTCRMGPRSSAVAYMYAGLRAGAEPAEVIAEARRNGAPFTKNEELEKWVTETIRSLRGDGAAR